MTALRVHVDIACARWKKAFPRLRRKTEIAAAVAVLKAKKPKALAARSLDVTVRLDNDRALRRLNRAWRGKDAATNVLSFPQLEFAPFDPRALTALPGRQPVPLGDAVLAYETVRREAKAQGKTLEAHAIHLIVHGVLHLLGYDHVTAREARAMEKTECDILAFLGYPDPYHAAPDQTARRRRHV